MSTVPTPLEMNDDLAKTINAAVNPDEIRSAILAEAQRQIAAADKTRTDKEAEEKAAADRLAAAAPAAPVVTDEPKVFSRVETIGGKEFTFEAPTEEELNRSVLNAYRVAFAVQPTQQEPAPVVPDAAETARIAAEEVQAKADLELSFKRGDISASEYIQKSGAVKDYLEQSGVSMDALKATTEESKSKAYMQSWAQATEKFITSAASEGWPGGERNTYLVGMKIAELGLTDATDKVAAMAQAYNALKSVGMLFPPDPKPADPNVPPAPAATTEPVAPVTPPTPVAPAVPAVPAKAAATSSSLFDRSSGTPDTTIKPPAAPPAIDPNASPAELLDAWKKAQFSTGKNPNEAFDEIYRKK